MTVTLGSAAAVTDRSTAFSRLSLGTVFILGVTAPPLDTIPWTSPDRLTTSALSVTGVVLREAATASRDGIMLLVCGMLMAGKVDDDM